MPGFLSVEWTAALDAALSDASLTTAPTDTVIIQYVIGGVPTYHLSLSEAGARCTPGPAEAPTVTFAQDLETATAVHRGDLSAEEAFITGRITMAGDALALLATRDALAEVATITATVSSDP